MNLTIRPMVESDISVFNRIRNQSRQFLHDSTEYSVEQSLEWFRTAKPQFYMLMLDDDAIGYFRTSDEIGTTIYIGLDIDEDYRGKGYAIPAYQMFMQMLTEHGIKTFYLNVLGFNDRALHIYTKIGFSINSKKYDFYRKCDDYFMEYDTNDENFHHVWRNLSYSEKDMLRKSTVLITGCNGFIGYWLIQFYRYLNKSHGFGIRVYAVDIQDGLRDTSDLVGWLKSDPTNIAYYQLNITDWDELYKTFEGKGIDYIFNCAGIAVPSEYMRKPVDTLDVSYIGTQNILELATDFSVKSVVCFSSSEVYGSPEPEAIPTVEDHVGRIHTHSNRSCYDVGKMVLETLCYTYHQQHKVPVKVIRPFNLYGPFMDDTRVVPNFIRRILSDEAVLIYGTGDQTRTFCYVADALTMILKIGLGGENGGIYNVGTSEPEVTIHNLVEAFEIALNRPVTVSVIPYPGDYPDNEPKRRCPDMKKTTKLTGYLPKFKLSQGLKLTFDYFKNK